MTLPARNGVLFLIMMLYALLAESAALVPSSSLRRRLPSHSTALNHRGYHNFGHRLPSTPLVFVPSHAKPSFLLTKDFAHRSASLRKSQLHMSTGTPSEGINIAIEYCSACRWMLRSNWIATELLTTFANDAKLASVTMIPTGPPLSEGGIFRVSSSDGDSKSAVLWDRKTEGRFPEAKEVKQLVRDCVDPEKDLGHSERNKASGTEAVQNDCVECKEQQEEQRASKQESVATKQTEQLNTQDLPSTFHNHNHISIEYSTGSSVESAENGLYQAAYYANELLSMVYERNAWWKKHQEDDAADDEAGPVAVDSVTLIPNRLASGVLQIKLNDERLVYERTGDTSASNIDGGHLRDVVKGAILGVDSGSSVVQMMDEDEAEEARKYFGVF